MTKQLRPVSGAPPKYTWWERLLTAFCTLYLLITIGGLGLHQLIGRDWWWLFLLSSLSVYLFIPLPLVLLTAWRTRRRELWLGFFMGVGLWLYLYGALFWPETQAVQANDQILRVATYNALGTNPDTAGMLAVIRETNADVIAIQELNPELARALVNETSELYPYQTLQPEVGVTGMGIISRYPLQSLPFQSEAAYWIGQPQLARLDFNGQAVVLFNFHAVPPQAGARHALDIPRAIRATMGIRERQAEAIAALANQYPGPLIVMGDLNANDQSRAYRIATAQLGDAWRDAGWGYGASFHGFLGPPFVRIDYIFYSHHWQAVSAEMGRDGGSDHLPITADLLLTTDDGR
jgi:vancomycin resistance protein VanJ